MNWSQFATSNFYKSKSGRSMVVRMHVLFSQTNSGDAHCGRCDFIGGNEDWLMKRVVQIGEGKIFGGYEFVKREAGRMGDKFSGRATAKPVAGEVYATHGNLLAKKVA